jgi:hypothetical protein
MERVGSLPWLEEPATCSYPEPGHSNPVFNIISWRSILILSPHPLLDIPVDPFPSDFETIIL